jgi:hypothetical protein
MRIQDFTGHIAIEDPDRFAKLRELAQRAASGDPRAKELLVSFFEQGGENSIPEFADQVGLLTLLPSLESTDIFLVCRGHAKKMAEASTYAVVRGAWRLAKKAATNNTRKANKRPARPSLSRTASDVRAAVGHVILTLILLYGAFSMLR